MTGKILAIILLALAVGFAVGFLVANALNRSELERITSELEASRTDPVAAPQVELSNEEIRQKIAEADGNPENFDFQKSLGLALYRYAAMKGDRELLKDVARLLGRANGLRPDDYDLLVSLGNVHFDLGQLNKDEESNLRSRGFYETALGKNPKDVNVRTDLGLTFLLSENPNVERAIDEFNRSLETDPRHEKTLQGLARAYARTGDRDEARKYLVQLKEINPENPLIAELESELAKENIR